MRHLLTILLLLPLVAMISWTHPDARHFPPIAPEMKALIGSQYKMFTRTAVSYSPGEYLGVGVTSDGFGFVMTDAFNIWCNSAITTASGAPNLIGTDTLMGIAVNNLHNANWISLGGVVWGGGQQCGNPYITGTNIYPEDLDSAGNTRHFTSISNFWNNPDGEEGYTVGIEVNHTLWICGDTRNGARGNGTAGQDLSKWVQVPLPANIIPRKVSGAFTVFVLCDTVNSGGTIIGQRLYSWTNSGSHAASLGYGNPAFGAGATTISTYNVPTEILFNGQHAHNIAEVTGGLECNYARFDSAISGRPDSTRLYCWGSYGWRMAHSTTVAQDNLNTPTDITSKVLTSTVTTAAGSTQIDTVVTDNGSTHILVGNASTSSRLLVGWGSSEQGTLGNGLQLNFATTPTPYYEGGQDEYLGQVVQFTPVIICPGKYDWVQLADNKFYGYYNQYKDSKGWTFCGRYKTYMAALGMHPADYLSSNLSGVMNCGWQYPYFTRCFDAFAVTAAPTIGQGCSNACVAGPTTSSQCSAITSTCSSIHAGLSVITSGTTAFMNASSSTYGGTRLQHMKFYVDGVIAPGLADNPVEQTDTANGLSLGSHTGKVVVQGQYFEADSTTFSFTVSGQTGYYFKKSGSGTACTIGAPCPPSYFNTLYSVAGPGDTFYLNRNDTFAIQMVANSFGSAGNPIVVKPYGTGNEPIIGGTTTLSGWTNVSGNVWEVPYTGPWLNWMTLNGALMTEANELTWLIPTSMTSTTITDAAHAGLVTIGTKIAIRSSAYTIDTAHVTNVSGSVITFSPAATYNPSTTGGNGWLIMNNTPIFTTGYQDTLGQARIYSVGTPSGIYKIAAVDTPLLDEGGNQEWDSIDFQGGNFANVILAFQANANILFKGCTNEYSVDGYQFRSEGGVSIIGGLVQHMTNNGKLKQNANNYNNYDSAITVYDIGMNPGMGRPGSFQPTYTGWIGGDSGSVVVNIIVDSTGYDGIVNYGSGFKIIYNLIQQVCQILEDGAGAYTYINGLPSWARQPQIVGNLIMISGSSVSHNGSNLDFSSAGNGIYLDNYTKGVLVQYNTISGCNSVAIYDHGPGNSILNNTTYNSGFAECLVYELPTAITGMNVQNNSFNAINSGTYSIVLQTVNNDIASFGTFNNNHFNHQNTASSFYKKDNTGAGSTMNFATWQSTYGYESTGSFTQLTANLVVNTAFTPATVTFPFVGLWNSKYYRNKISLQALSGQPMQVANPGWFWRYKKHP